MLTFSNVMFDFSTLSIGSQINHDKDDILKLLFWLHKINKG